MGSVFGLANIRNIPSRIPHGRMEMVMSFANFQKPVEMLGLVLEFIYPPLI